MGQKYDSYTHEQKAAINWVADGELKRLIEMGSEEGMKAQNNPQKFLEQRKEAIDPEHAVKLYNASQRNDRWLRNEQNTSGKMGLWDRTRIEE